jgi:hypothetical protein
MGYGWVRAWKLLAGLGKGILYKLDKVRKGKAYLS